MADDPSWDVMPVANPDLPARKRNRFVDRAVLKDPVGIAEPLYQLRDREQLVVPSSLDRLSRELLLRAQRAIAVAVGDDAATEPDGAVPEGTLLRHEWEIAVALRDLTDLREEHGLNAAASVGPMTDAVLRPQRTALARTWTCWRARLPTSTRLPRSAV